MPRASERGAVAPASHRSTVTLRRAELGDFPALADLYLAARRSAFTWLPASGFQHEDFFRDTQGETIWVALDGTEAVGFASVYSQSAFLHSLYIRPDRQHQGIGKVLLDHVLRTTPGRVTLKCLTLNRAAQNFYLARGWSIIGSGESAHGAYLTFEAPLPTNNPS